MKILLGNFNSKVGREDIFKPTIGNESLHEINNDNGVRLVNVATSKNLRVKSTMFPHRNIHKYTWTSPNGKTHNQMYHILVDRRIARMGDKRNANRLLVGKPEGRRPLGRRYRKWVDNIKKYLLEIG
jgi:hypothetical protein